MRYSKLPSRLVLCKSQLQTRLAQTVLRIPASTLTPSHTIISDLGPLSHGNKCQNSKVHTQSMLSRATRAVRPLTYFSHRPVAVRTFSLSIPVQRASPILVNMDAKVESTNKTAITSHNQYKTAGIERDELSSSPIVQFNNWFKHANQNGVPEPEAMTLSTVAFDSKTGVARPSSRVVLLKQVDPEGFLFFSNYSSRKGRELESNPYASLAFYWKELSRSVRVCGRVEKLTPAQSKEYYDSRPSVAGSVRGPVHSRPRLARGRNSRAE